MGAFPNLSRNVPFCPRLSSFVPICPCSGPQEGQKRTNGDKTGHFGTNWETPPFSIYPHLALLKECSEMLGFFPGKGGRKRYRKRRLWRKQNTLGNDVMMSNRMVWKIEMLPGWCDHLGCPKARDNFGTLWPLPEKTTCSFPYRFSGKSRNSGLVPDNRDPKNNRQNRKVDQKLATNTQTQPNVQNCQEQDRPKPKSICMAFCNDCTSGLRKADHDLQGQRIVIALERQ